MTSSYRLIRAAAVATFAGATLFATAAAANPLGPFAIFQPLLQPGYDATQPAYPAQPAYPTDRIAPAVQAPADSMVDPDADAQLPARLQRQVVNYRSSEAPGTIIVDTPHTYLYLVLGDGKALRYGIGVGREGFTWSGVKAIARKAEWPDWTPPKEMLERQPYLPRFMAGGPGNPLGARALYIGGTMYRIHGTNAPQTIGTQVSSGCIRLTNEDITDLYSRVKIGAKVIVLPMSHTARNEDDRPQRAAAVASTAVRGVY